MNCVFPMPFPSFFFCFFKLNDVNISQNVKLYLSCVSPALMLILPTVSWACLSGPPQGIIVLTRFHMFFHRAAPSQRSFRSIRSPKSLSRVIRKVRLVFPEMGLVLDLKVRTKIYILMVKKDPPLLQQHKNLFVSL